MPRQPKNASIVCDNFTWYLRRKSTGVYFADGRINSQFHLGKPSLGTRNHEEALRRLRELDRRKAVEFGLVAPAPRNTNDDISVESGWLAKKEYADRTIVLELNVICSVVKWLVEEEHLPPSCRFLLKLSKPEGSTTYCYTKQQVSRMVEFCNATPSLDWLAQVIIALATSGLRINELAKLRWTDIDFPSNTICLTDERARPRRKQTGQERRIKGKRGRALPMHPAFRDVLAALPRHRDGLIFRGQQGGNLSDRRVLEALQGRVIESLKVEFPTPDGETGFAGGTVHGLRHYFCSEAYRNGAKDAELLEWLGHRDSEIMKIYRHLRREDSHRRMEQINFLGSDGGGECDSDVA